MIKLRLYPMKYLKYAVGGLFIVSYSIFGQTKIANANEMIEFKNVWVMENKENAMKFKPHNTDTELFFNAIFNKDTILSFYIILGYSCNCTLVLDRKDELRYITDTGSHLCYKAGYVYTEYSIKSPKELLIRKEIPVELWVNRVNHKVDLKINNETITKHQVHHRSSISINSFLQNYGGLPSSASLK